MNWRLTDMTSGVTRDIEAASVELAEVAAGAWMRDCEWGNGETIWPRVRIEELNGDAETTEASLMTVAINPPEPQCADAGEAHDWQAPYEAVGGIRENPGVWSHGGGVVMHECCVRCGCGRVVDTWAQDHATGEQGLKSVRYEPGKYRDYVEALEAAEKEEEEEACRHCAECGEPVALVVDGAGNPSPVTCDACLQRRGAQEGGQAQ